MRFLLPWNSKPVTDLEIEDDLWFSFLDGIGAWVLFWVFIASFTIALIYYLSARSKKIQKPSDLFSPFIPLWSLILFVVPGFIVGLTYLETGFQIFGEELSLSGRAIMSGFVAAGYTAVFAYIVIILLTWFALPQFKYRPISWWFWLIKSGKRKTAT